MDKLEELRDWIGELNWEGVENVLSDVVDKIDELNRPLVVTKDLGEWLGCQKLGNKGILFSIIIELGDMWSRGYFEEFIDTNKKELIEVILGTRPYEVEKDEFQDGHLKIKSMDIVPLIEQLDEPEKPSKPVIPKIVAEQLEYWKRNKMNILWQFFLREIPSSTLSWLESDAGNYDKLLDAEKNGYEVEEEILWEIPMPDLKTTGGHIQYLTYDPKVRTYFASIKNGKLKQTFNAKDLASVPGQYRRHAEMCGFKKIQEVAE